jgi:hypothetical protein
MFSLAWGDVPLRLDKSTVHGSMPYALAIGAGTFAYLHGPTW